MDTRQTKNWDKTTYNKIEIKFFVDLSALKSKASVSVQWESG